MTMNVRLLATATDQTVDTGNGTTRQAVGNLEETAGALHITNGLGPMGAGVGEKVVIGATTAQSTGTYSGGVDVVCDTPCFIEVGSNPTAVIDTSYRLPANSVIRVPVGISNKLAVIGTSGNLWIHPVA